MSKSEGNSLYLLDSDDEIKKKISKALTGGQKTLEDQKKKGGNPDKDMLFELFKQHLIKSDKELEKRIKDYKEGKILDSEIKVHATCVRVPVFIGHAEAVNLELETPLSAEQALQILSGPHSISRLTSWQARDLLPL